MIVVEVDADIPAATGRRLAVRDAPRVGRLAAVASEAEDASVQIVSPPEVIITLTADRQHPFGYARSFASGV
jgi:hypothetical protein